LLLPPPSEALSDFARTSPVSENGDEVTDNDRVNNIKKRKKKFGFLK